ncbi:unnamed protein product [Bursaphelenchus xylophilus]|uniref:(pine wood nematode) hypothetical protein n=1 Tax=Bursaphelenchus xylophilus TaxID=6326 RepID=A0A1I7SAV2_BURXY|nr:unnamed protein product [Bursaphelenchus xylophilus]CAG9126740.1 unnamed protein product [Bursaphelenchus xylophilus]
MSSSLLQKTLKLDEDENNLRFKLNSRQKRHNVVEQEKEMLKANGDLYTLDLDSGELKKKSIKGRISARKIKDEKMSVALAKQGFSLVDQYRRNKPKDIEARNRRYLEFVEQAQINDGILSRITEKERIQSLEKKARIEKRKDLRSIVRRDRVKKSKQDSKSIFSDADFDQLGGSAGSLLDNFKRIK